MSDMTMGTAPVSKAKGWVNTLIAAHFRGPGDTVEASIARAARKHGLDHGMLWRLRYRSPKRIWADVYLSLEQAVAAEVKSQEARLAHEIELTRALGLSEAGSTLVDEAEALLGTSASAAEAQAREHDDQSINWR